MGDDNSINNEQNLANEVLIMSEKRHRSILRAAMDGFWMFDLEGRLLEVNDTYSRISGYSELELLTMSVSDLEILETGEMVAARNARIVEQGEDRYETQHRRKDGSIIDLEVSAQYWTFEGGRIIAFLRDISERKKAEQALQHEHNLYEDLVNTLPAGVYRLRAKLCGNWETETWRSLMETQYSTDMASDRFCAILGISLDEIIVNPGIVPDVIHPDDKENFNERNAQAMTGLHTFIWEGRIICNQQIKWVHFESLPRVIDAETVLWTGIVYEITERKQAEESLRQTEQKLRLVVEHSTNLFYMHTTDNIFTYVSPQSWQFFDCAPEEAMGQWTELLSDNPLNQIGVESTQRAIETGERQPSYQLELIGRKGRKIWVEVTEAPIVEKGNVIAISGSLTDITERKQAEEALRESVEKYRAMVEAFDGYIYICSKDFRIQFMNEKLIHRTGRNATGEYCYEALHNLDTVCEWCVNELVFTGEHVCWEIKSPKDGRWYEINNSPIYNANGTISKQAMITDFTVRKLAMEEKVILQAQLHQAQKMESVGRLAGGVAHDFNNMLCVILGYAELAQQKENDSSQLREYLEQIHKTATRSADIVRQLLAFARKQTVAPKVLDLNETVQGMLKMLTRLIGEDIDLVWLPEEVLWPVKIDPTQIDQVLANLCINARDATAGVGKINIETENKICDAHFCKEHIDFVPGEYVTLSVCDDGCGMDQETLKNIFEPFFTTKGVGEGTGLGLATVYGIVKQNGGFIDVYSELGKGTCFKFFLPRFLGKVERERTTEVKSPVERGRETVLLVEDEPAILDIGKQLLEMKGYRVLSAGTPGEAIRLAEEHIGEIHLLLTDVVMPEMNGRELARKLLSLYPGLKCLFMSGYTANVIAHHGVLDESVQFIQKPFSLDALAAKVREALDH